MNWSVFVCFKCNEKIMRVENVSGIGSIEIDELMTDDVVGCWWILIVVSWYG